MKEKTGQKERRVGKLDRERLIKIKREIEKVKRKKCGEGESLHRTKDQKGRKNKMERELTRRKRTPSVNVTRLTRKQTHRHRKRNTDRGSKGEGEGDGGENPEEMQEMLSQEAHPAPRSALGKEAHTACLHCPARGNCTVPRNFPSLSCCKNLF